MSRRGRSSRYALLVAPGALCALFLLWQHDVKVLAWGCRPWALHECVVAVHTSETTTVLINNAKWTPPTWCQSAAHQSEANHPPFGRQNVSLGERRRCADRAYACARRKNVTLWYHHFHKAGGSTFVNLAKANGATLMPKYSNGNPLDATGARIPFWTFAPEKQARWAAKVRAKYGTDMVVTEFGFPSPVGLLPPGHFLYITVMREPVTRLVSNFFWRYRRYFSGQPEPRLPLGASPKFGDFAARQVNMYAHTLSGNGGALGPSDLGAATVTLRYFSVILICEWLDSSAKVLSRHLGWSITDFGAFHEKVRRKACLPQK